MIQSKRLFAATAVAIALIVSNAMSAEPVAPAKALPKTLDEQIKYLEGALAESLRARDLVMLDMAVKGFKAAKLADKDLELSMLRAERDAAWGMSLQYAVVQVPSASMEAWGLMARAKLGNNQALQTLRQLAGDLPPAPEALPEMNKVSAAEYHAKRIAQTEYAAKYKQRSHAIFALALLKEPGIQDKALAAIQNKINIDPQVMMGMFGGGTDPLILAVLASDSESGFKKLVEYCADEKYILKDQAGVLSELNGLMTTGGYFGVEEKAFSVSNDIRQRLPKDAQTLLVAPYVSLLKRYTPDPKQPWDMTLNSISNIGMSLPENALIPDGVTALDALMTKLPGPMEQYPKQTFMAILKKNGRDIHLPVKPPRPPAENSQF